jgi:hypothetical protein
MKKSILLLSILFLLASCQDEKTQKKQQIEFKQQKFESEVTLASGKDSTTAKVNIPIAQGKSVIADSINKKVFSMVKEIVYFDEKPLEINDYKDLLASFTNSYKKFVTDFPDYHLPWEATVDGKVIYQSDALICLEINHYSFTGGAHGNGGQQSLVVDATTGKVIPNDKLFKDPNVFKAFAEKEFRRTYKVPENGSINQTGMQFEDEQFHLPENIFFTDKGLLLYYNQYEVASYVDGTKQLLFPYDKINEYLNAK